MEAVTKLISTESVEERELAGILSRLADEGVTLTTLVEFLIARGHEREQQGLGLPTFLDVRGLLDALLQATPDNQDRWLRRFQSGAARYLCPDCGFSGNQGTASGDFKTPDSANVICPVCRCFKFEKYFTRAWTPDEQAAFEAEQEQMRPILAARESRATEARERARGLEPKVADVCNALDGVGGYVNEFEERQEIEPYVRGIVHRTARSVTEIVSHWRKYESLPIPTVEIAKAVNRVMLREASMKGILDNLDLLEPQEVSELRPQEAGEERFVFTREELEHEFKHRVEKWDTILSDREVATAALTDGRFVISILPKGWIEAHPCQCDDCKAARAAE